MALVIFEMETRLLRGWDLERGALFVLCVWLLRTKPQILSLLGKSSFHGPTLPALVSLIHPFLSFEFELFGGLGK